MVCNWGDIMLKKIDYTGHNKTVYICDRCKKELDTSVDRRYRVSVHIDKIGSKSGSHVKQIRAYDLCKRCCSILCTNIEKSKKKSDE